MDITPEIITDFRERYPAFSNVTTWPDSVIESALCEGDVETGSSRWGGYVDECSNFKQRGMFLFTAHWLVATYPRGATDVTLQNPAAGWATASKSVGDESIAYNNGKASELSVGDSWLASTGYGQQYMRLRKRAGMGAIAV